MGTHWQAVGYGNLPRSWHSTKNEIAEIELLQAPTQPPRSSSFLYCKSRARGAGLITQRMTAIIHRKAERLQSLLYKMYYKLLLYSKEVGLENMFRVIW